MTQPLSEDRHKVGKYEVVEKIGEGGYSCVHRGFDPLIKRQVAIKSCASADRETRERFYREAEIAGNLDHPNIVRVYDLFIEDHTPYLVQELLDGEDLDDRIERREPSAFSEKLLYLIQIARGLAYAHERGVIHRDIKPANIRVLDDGTVKILDFGIAKLAHYASDLTQKGMAVGTAAYLAPEQIRGEKASPATDIFAFGVLAYELLTSVRPFGRETISETFFQTLNHEPAPLTAHWADCPTELVAIVSRCLAKDPAERFGSCAELLAELEEARERLRSDWAPALNPAKTQSLPAAVDLDLRPPADPGGGTLPMPIDGRLRSRPSPPVDLPLQARPRGIPMAGAGHRRRSRAWIPLTLLLAAAACAWLWLPYDQVSARLGGWMAAAEAPAEPAPEPVAAAAPAAIEPPVEPESPPTAGAPVEQASATAAAPSAAPTVERETEPRAPRSPAAEAPRAATAPAPASLSFDGVWHPGIRLSVDGAPPLTLGSARAIPVEPGAHSLTFSIASDGYDATHTLGVRVVAGESKRIPVPIEPPGRLTVQAHLGSPQGLVRIDSRRLLQPTPLRAQPIAPGRHRISIFSHDDRSRPVFQSEVGIRAGHEAILTFDLEGTRQPHVREKELQR